MSDTIVDLGTKRLAPGEGHRLELVVPLERIELGGGFYEADPQPVPVKLEMSRTLGDGWAFRISASVGLSGPCTRCLAPAAPVITVDSREVDRPGGGEELESPYLNDEELDVGDWLRDAVVLGMPTAVLCHSNCPGLCEECGIRLAEAGPEHHHEKPLDPRWAALRDLEG